MQHRTLGGTRRLSRLFSSRPIVVAPIDDSLIVGPEGGLGPLGRTLQSIVRGKPNGLIMFRGAFECNNERIDASIPVFLNVTASIHGPKHTHKVLITSAMAAVRLGADGIAAHINIGSQYEPEMLTMVGDVRTECDRIGLPLLLIAYPRTEIGDETDNFESEKRNDVWRYTSRVRHAVRVAVELGADIVKTQYTGSAETFNAVVDSSCGVPVLIAGGQLVAAEHALRVARDAVAAGGCGVSFGRNVFNRPDPGAMIAALRQVMTADISDHEIRVLALTVEGEAPTQRLQSQVQIPIR